MGRGATAGGERAEWEQGSGEQLVLDSAQPRARGGHRGSRTAHHPPGIPGHRRLCSPCVTQLAVPPILTAQFYRDVREAVAQA